MRVLVTGGSGFIGSRVVHQLADRGYVVRCLLRSSSRTDRLQGIQTESVTGDMLEPESLQRAVRDCEAVVHLASVSNWKDIHGPRVRAVGIQGTAALIQAALDAGCRRLVFISSTASMGGEDHPRIRKETDPPSPGFEKLIYANMKRESEALCLAAQEQGMEVVIVNPGEVYGANDRDLVTAGNLIDLAQGPLSLVCKGGSGVAHVDDVAAGIVAALEKGRSGERYFLSSENLTNSEIAAAVLDTLGRKQPIVNFPRPIVRGLGWLGMRFSVPLPFNAAIAPYATRYWFVDNSKAREELGVCFRPARTAIADAVAWLKTDGRIR
jgi:dihydroflavonol-4-reductase